MKLRTISSSFCTDHFHRPIERCLYHENRLQKPAYDLREDVQKATCNSPFFCIQLVVDQYYCRKGNLEYVSAVCKIVRCPKQFFKKSSCF